jgi:hypothetical protein
MVLGSLFQRQGRNAARQQEGWSRRDNASLRHSELRAGFVPRLEGLETRILPAISFTPGPYTVPAINPEQARGIISTLFPREPQIAVNPTDADNLVLSSQGGLEVSTDGGATYNVQVFFPNSNGGDTSIVFDSQGRLFWSNLAGNYYSGQFGGTPMVVQVDPHTGAFLGAPVVVSTPSSVADFQVTVGDDKPVLGTDGTNLYMVWERYTPGNSDWVLLSRSADQGQTWSPATIVTNPIEDGFVWGSSVAVLSNGTVGVTYHATGGFVGSHALEQTVQFAGYSNDLSTFLYNNTVSLAMPPAFPNEPWTTLLGNSNTWALPDPARPGNIYTVFNNIVTNSQGNYIWEVDFASSSDFGQSWTTDPIYAGDVNSFSVIPTAAIDQFGDVVVTWYTNSADLFDSSGYYLLDVDAMYSTDGGATWSGAFQVNKTNHFDPNAPGPNNTNRIADFYSVAFSAGTAYIAWEGNTFDNMGNVTGQQIFTSEFGINGSLNVTGDSSLGNAITLETNPNNAGEFHVKVNGTAQYATPISFSLTPIINLTSIATLPDAGTIDAINVEDTYASTPLTINLGSGVEIVNISPSGELLSNIQGTVNVVGAGKTYLNIFDENYNPSGLNKYTLTDSTFQRPFASTISYSDVSVLTIHGAKQFNTYDIQNTASSCTTTVDTGADDNAVGVHRTSKQSTLDIVGGGSLLAAEISDKGSAQHILGTVNVENPLGLVDLVVDDSADPFFSLATMGTFVNTDDSEYLDGNRDAWEYIHGLAPAPINYELTDIQNATIKTGFIIGVRPLVQLLGLGGPLHVVGNGMMSVNVGNDGSMQGIQGALAITNSEAGGTTLNLNDFADTTAQTVTLATILPAAGGPTVGSVTGLAPATITYDYAGTSSVTLVTSNASGKTIDVLGTGVPVRLQAPGPCVVNVGMGSLAGIRAPVSILAPQAGGVSVAIDDSADAAPSNSFTIAPTGVLFDGLPVLSGAISSLTIKGGADTTFILDNIGSSIASLTINGGPGNNLLVVEGTPPANLSLTNVTGATATSLTDSVNPSILGQLVTFTATVSPAVAAAGTPTGRVDFFDTSTNTDLGSVALSGGSASLNTSALAVGNHVIVASYSGASLFLPSHAVLTQQVHYTFSGFLAPLNQGLAFAAGRTVPIRFQLTDYNNNFITSLSAVTALQVLYPDNSTHAISGLRYDSTANQFIANWSTNGLAAGSYTISLSLLDGTTHTVTLTITASHTSAGLTPNAVGGTTAAAGGLLGSGIDLYADNSIGDVTAGEVVRIQDAVTAVGARMDYDPAIRGLVESPTNMPADDGTLSFGAAWLDSDKDAIFETFLFSDPL